MCLLKSSGPVYGLPFSSYNYNQEPRTEKKDERGEEKRMDTVEANMKEGSVREHRRGNS